MQKARNLQCMNWALIFSLRGKNKKIKKVPDLAIEKNLPQIKKLF